MTIFHRASGNRLVTVWLRRRNAKDPADFEPLRVATETRFFDGGVFNALRVPEPAVAEAAEYIRTRVNPEEYDAYEIILWTPQYFQGGSIGAPPAQERPMIDHRIEVEDAASNSRV